MMLDNLWDLQKIIHQKLIEDNLIKNFVTGVYTKVPQDTLFPYLIINFDEVKDDSMFGMEGANVNLSVKIISRDHGLKNLFKLSQAIEKNVKNIEYNQADCKISKIVFLGIEFSHLKDGYTQIMNLKFLITLRGNYDDTK